MSIFDDWFDISTEAVNGHDYKAINILDEDHEPVVEDVAQVVSNHYIAPDSIARTLERLSKVSTHRLKKLLYMKPAAYDLVKDIRVHINVIGMAKRCSK